MPSSSFVHNTPPLSEDSVRFLTEPSHTHSQTPCELLGLEPCPGVLQVYTACRGQTRAARSVG